MSDIQQGVHDSSLTVTWRLLGHKKKCPLKGASPWDMSARNISRNNMKATQVSLRKKRSSVLSTLWAQRNVHHTILLTTHKKLSIYYVWSSLIRWYTQIWTVFDTGFVFVSQGRTAVTSSLSGGNIKENRNDHEVPYYAFFSLGQLKPWRRLATLNFHEYRKFFIIYFRDQEKDERRENFA